MRAAVPARRCGNNDDAARPGRRKGGGWPTTALGRIGFGLSASDPELMYSMVEGIEQGQRGLNTACTRQPRRPAGTKVTTRTCAVSTTPVRVHPTDPNTFWFSSTPVLYSRDGGKTVGNATVGIHVDHHAMWIDPTDPQRMIVGNDGGIALSWDGGGTWDFQNHMALGQFYEVSYDMAVPYRVCGGLQQRQRCGRAPPRERTTPYGHWGNGGDGSHAAARPITKVIYASRRAGACRASIRRGSARVGTPRWRKTYTLRDSGSSPAATDAPGDVRTPGRVAVCDAVSRYSRR